MQYWIFKTEPTECSIEDLMNASESTIWEGVRNYQARNYLRTAGCGDLVLIHHSSCAEVGIAGVARIIGTAFADPSQFDSASPYFDSKHSLANPRWSAVKLQGIERFNKILSLQELRQQAELQQMQLLRKGNRLSVMPITEEEYQLVYFLGKV